MTLSIWKKTPKKKKNTAQYMLSFSTSNFSLDVGKKKFKKCSHVQVNGLKFDALLIVCFLGGQLPRA